MLKPTYKIKIGSETFEPGVQSPVSSVRVTQDIEVPADGFEVVLGVSEKTSTIKEGDEISIEIGYGDELKEVFKGAVDSAIPGISGVRVRGLNPATKLLELRVNNAYMDSKAGDIVNDLAGKAGVKTDEVSDGIKFPVYYLDDGKNAHEHILELARKCGFDVYMTPENKLVFKAYERSDPHALEYGVNIIEADVQEDRPVVKSVVVLGEGASSFKGAESWHWLTKKLVSGSQKSDLKGAELLIQDPSVKDSDAAAIVADSLLQEMTKTLCGTVKILGDAGVKLGDTIEIKGMGNSKMNGEFQVRSVEHEVSKATGFTTLIGWRK